MVSWWFRELLEPRGSGFRLQGGLLHRWDSGLQGFRVWGLGAHVPP